MKIKQLSLRSQLNLIFLPLFLVFITPVIIINYFITKDNINHMINDQLKHLSNSVSINIKSLINITMREHLKRVVEKKQSLIEEYAGQIKKGELLHKKLIDRILIGKIIRAPVKNVFFFMVDISQYPNVTDIMGNPGFPLGNVQLKSLIEEATDNIYGYMEFYVENPSSFKRQKKSLYYTLIKKYNLVLFAVSNKEEVGNLMDLDDISDDVLSIRIGVNGYASILDMDGNLLVHPWNQNENVYHLKDAHGKTFIKEIINNKNGSLTYDWEYGQGIQKSVAYYRYIPDTKIILWISACLADHYEPLYRIRHISIAILVLAILVTFPAIIYSASVITRPLIDIINTFKEITEKLNFKEVHIHANKEAMALGKSFNIMIRKIKEASDELHEEISERKKAEEERDRVEKERESLIVKLEAQNTELELFNYMVSHDLKSPLVTIRGFIGFLLKDINSGNIERARSDIERINNATKKMQRLLNELLELSRIGRVVNPPENIPLNELIPEAITTVSGRLEKMNIQVFVSDSLPTVYGDRSRVCEVFENLIDNAAKFMGDQPHPKIDIRTRQDGKKTVVYVKDNGIGIDPKYHEKVFDLFSRLDQNIEGTGIGLAIVKRIVEIQGGRIWAESQGLKKGTTICLILPNESEINQS